MRRPRTAYAAPAWAAEQRFGPGGVGLKATLLLLAQYADEDFSCYPGQQRIADETDQSVSTVARQLKRLEDLGLIRRVHRQGAGGHRTSDRYFLQIDVVIDLVNRTSPTRQSDGMEPGSYPSPEPSLPVTSPDPMPSPSDGGTPRELLEGTPSTRDARVGARGTTPTVGGELVMFPVVEAPAPSGPSFEDFWAVYPRHKARDAAQRAWVKAIKRADPALIVARAAMYAAVAPAPAWDPARGEMKDVRPYPASWLNAGQWSDDDLTAPPPMTREEKFRANGLPEWAL